MAIPIIAGLAARVRGLLPLIQGGVNQGLSITAVNVIIKSVQGKGIRRQTLSDVMRAYRNIAATGPQLRSLNLNAIPNINRLPPALTRIRRKLSFIVKVTGLQVDSGLKITQMVTVALDVAVPRSEIERIAEDAIMNKIDKYKLEIESSLIQTGMIAGAAGIL